MLGRLLAIALAGALGTLARYGLSGLCARCSVSFPWGTLAVNLLGCFGLGLLMGVATGGRGLLPASLRSFLGTGFFGAFTTFSPFA